MKNLINNVMYASLLVFALIFTSCQSEFEEINDGTSQDETITSSSATAKLIERTSSNDGSFDNIVDGASCFAIQFPYNVNVNGIDITIDAVEDLRLIEEIFDEVEIDDDILDIIFPITVTLADFTEVVINSKEDLREIAKDCIEGGDDNDIECIDFVYPITLFTFDINEVRTGEVTVENDKQLRRFFANLGENDLISIQFPVTLELFDGTKETVNSNEELANAIERAENICDEDDDDDFNDDDFSKERLDDYLLTCPWLIHEVKRNDQDQTDQYFEYAMNFTEDGAVTMKDREGNSLMGTWSTRVTDNGALIKLEFDALVDFSLEWFVYEVGEGKIKLYVDGGNRIIMKKACDMDPGGETDPNTLREILKECSWIIKKVKNNGEEVDRLLGYEFEFMADNVITLSNGETTSDGTWEITENEKGYLVMAITMGEEPGVSFEWPLRDLNDNRLKFEVEGFELILLRECNDSTGDNDIPEIRNFLLGGNWTVAQYIDVEMDETDNYGGYSLSFMPENKLSVLEGNEAFMSGLWRVLRDTDDGYLRLYLNLHGDLELFNELTDAWKIISATADRIELKRYNSDGAITTMVLEK